MLASLIWLIIQSAIVGCALYVGYTHARLLFWQRQTRILDALPTAKHTERFDVIAGQILSIDLLRQLAAIQFQEGALWALEEHRKAAERDFYPRMKK